MRRDWKDRHKGYLVQLLTPPPEETATEWAEENVVIPEGAGAISGSFSTRYTPYIREPLDCYGDKKVTDLVLCFGTQTSKTTAMIVGQLYRIARDPIASLWVTPNENLGKSFSKQRWQKFAKACRPVNKQIPRTVSGAVDRFRYGNLEQQYDRCSLNFVGSNSPANLASRPVGLLQMDETDKYADEDEFEAGALELAENRTKTYPFPLRVKSSTPTTEEGMIWREFLLTDQRYYFVPCPCCHEFIQLKFTVKSELHGNCGLRWWEESEDESKIDGAWDIELVKKNAHYKCQECGGKIFSHHKPSMLNAGEWRATNPRAAAGRRGYHLSSLYSILGPEVTFEGIAAKWVQVQRNTGKRHDFINSWLAETWDKSKAHDERPIVLEEYGNEALPEESTAIMGIDRQDNHYWVVIRKFALRSEERPNGESWLLFCDMVETEGLLLELQEEYGVLGKNVVIDFGGRINQVAKLAVKNDWRGMMGSDKPGFPHKEGNERVIKYYSEVHYRDPHLGTKWQDRLAQHERAMFVQWSNDRINDLVTSLRFTRPNIWHIHSSPHEKYQRHLNSRAKMKKIDMKGREVEYWHTIHRNDTHLLDCECMVTTRALQLGLVPTLDESALAFQAA